MAGLLIPTENMKRPKQHDQDWLGIMGIAIARLYDSNGREIARCTDTPNAIASAFRECSRAQFVKPFMGTIETRERYTDRMEDWNDCPSGLVIL